MMQLHDLDVQHLKDIPGYKAILKAVIKSQIQGLVEQLADQTGEESVILTASTSDGTLCHLGSLTGKNFLEGRDEIKSQFLRFCLKKQQKRKAPSPPRLSEFSDDEEDNVHPSMSRQSGHQFSPSVSSQSHHTIPQRIHPVALTRVNPGGTPGAGRRTIQPRPYTTTPPHRQDQGRRNTFNKPQSFNSSSSTPSTSSSNITATAVDVHQIDLSQQSIKQEGMAMNTSRDENHDDSFSSHPAFSSSSSPHESGTTTITQSDLSASVKSDQQQRQQLDDTASDEQKKNESNLSNLIPASAGEIDTSNVKIEPVTEGEMELEITGVEMAEGSASFSGDNSWLQNDSQRLGYDPSTSGLDSIAGPSQGGDMASYSSTKLSSRSERWRQQSSSLQDDSFLLNSLYDQSISDTSLSSQYGGHEQDATYCCSECGKSFKSLYNLKNHRRLHMGYKPFHCDVCGHRFAHKATFDRHKLTHTGEKPFACDLCGQRFARKANMQLHMRRHRVGLM